MSAKTDEKVGKYIQDIKEKVGEEPDVALIRKITESLGPVVFRNDAETVSSSSEDELETVKQNFLIKKLGLPNDSKLDVGLNAMLEKYGKSNRNKYRVTLYYLLTKYFNKESVFA
ncbi:MULTISPECIES: DUF2853 family protein [unclassified Zunongwangia]|uniref:DUF2853 family protein n=1 Tax=unclassified Zunongwangia TaxID=2632541 RepID=UPI0022DD8B1E|nr:MULTISPECIES: DUF2853 family protein [unclassified Zunongwangia]WBL21229.1 DUF2853 family protein [Zunongwangia sp. HRR-M8]WBL26910.1 DUF2853 family protein [Zunongwangia sp. HGR-M22]